MPSIKGTQTEKNLLIAFAGESQARNRYTYFSKTAKAEGYEQISAVFMETAEQESQHAKRFFEQLEGGDLCISATFPAGVIGTTLENLRASAAGEHHEWVSMYPEFAATARAEGFEVIAKIFEAVMVAEKNHEAQYQSFITNLENKQVFERDEPVTWICRKCGYSHTGKEAPKVCPACKHPQAYFELRRENW